jgi:hypothetical protein
MREMGPRRTLRWRISASPIRAACKPRRSWHSGDPGTAAAAGLNDGLPRRIEETLKKGAVGDRRAAWRALSAVLDRGAVDPDPGPPADVLAAASPDATKIAAAQAFASLPRTATDVTMLKIDLGGVIERHACSGGRCGGVLDALALSLLYRFGFSLVRPLRRAVKASTSHLEVEVIVRRVRWLVDGHNSSAFCRVRLAIQLSMSVSVNIIFSRCLPLPTLM